jgi:acetyl-CoA synthetase
MVTDDPTPHLERFRTYQEAVREFRWLIPRRINLASAICRRHSDSVTRIALSDIKFGGINTYTFGGLDYLSDKFASALSACNVNPNDAVAIALPPSAAWAVAHLSALKTGSVLVPLPPSSNASFVEYVLEAIDAKVLILNEALLNALQGTETGLKNRATYFVVRDLRPAQEAPESQKDFWSEIDRCPSDFAARDVDVDSPMFIFFVQRDGKTFGIVHSVRSVISQMAGFEFFNEFDTRAVFWVGDDWCSPSAILGALYPAWWYGCSIVASVLSEQAIVRQMLDECEVTNIFLAANDSSRQQAEGPSKIFPNTKLNEAYGTAETGWIMGYSRKWLEGTDRPLCRVVPGRLVEIVDHSGNELPPGIVGQIAVHKTDIGLFSGYQGETAETPSHDWFLFPEYGYKTATGEVCITGRKDA